MKLRRLFLWMALVSWPAHSQSIASRGDYRPVARALQTFIQREMKEKGLPAVSIALVDGHGTVWSQGFGFADPDHKIPATADTVYRIGSVSKLFTDIGIMQLVERGKIDLDAPVTRYLPEFRPRNPFGKPITLRELMSHRSGLVREPPVGHYFDSSSPSLARTVDSLNETGLVYAPGARTKYSNAGIAVVGYVLERTQKEPFARYLKHAVLQPMGLSNSAFEPEPAITRNLAKAYMWTYDRPPFPAPTFELGMAPAGSMYSTVNDLARFVRTLLAGGGPLLRRETLDRMWTPQFAPAGAKTGYGLGFRISDLDGHRLIGHGGAIYGFATELEVLPGDQLGAIAVTTKDGANSVVTGIANQALRWMLAARAHKTLPAAATITGFPFDQIHKVEGPPPPKPAPMPPRWRGLIGQYGWDYNTLYIFEDQGKLTALIEWFFVDHLDEVSPTEFRFPSSSRLYDGEKLVFTVGPGGRATAVRVSGALFPRRPDPAAAGETFRIRPLKPVGELRREALATQPPKETGEFRKPDLVDVAKLDPAIRLDIRYATTNNFMSAPFYTQARAFLERPAAEALLRALHTLKAQGYGLLIHDAYRPWYVTKMFWEGTPPDKRIFVADPAEGSRHNRGCAVDLTLYGLKTGKPVEMTGGYDEMSERSYPGYPGGTSLERWHRDLLRRAMEAQGFQVYDFEWWHFDYKYWNLNPILNVRFEDINN